MKKLVIITALVMVGVGFAYASSLSVPWFVDKASLTNAGFPPQVKGIETLVYLHNNQSVDVTCSIEYFTPDGLSLGPSPTDVGGNSFSIKAKSTLAFRPAATDPASAGSGQEGTTGLLVPNAPQKSTVVDGVKDVKNGSAVVTWVGGASDVQGIILNSQNLDVTQPGRISTWGTLLPPGA